GTRNTSMRVPELAVSLFIPSQSVSCGLTTGSLPLPFLHSETGCVFPFIYKRKAYQSCIRLDHNEGKAWCATTPDYQTGLKWRLCNEADCVFPFVFRGKSYHSCTRDGRADNMQWCSLTSNADANMTWLLC
uniref:Fibronectin type-II domain-containing protein n=1 Tax=Varanus komodoensis TaxID=61221 RepID=A0A8D2J837_VARKO